METWPGRLISGARIRARARAADTLLALETPSKDAFAALEERVRNRSLHRHWMFHGFDGAISLRTLILLRAPQAVDVAREMLWRDDPALEPVIDPRWKNPRAWTDFRVKMVIFPALAKQTQSLVDGLVAAAKEAGLPFAADCQGGMFGFFLLPQLPQNYAAVMKSDAAQFGKLFHGLLDRGVYIAPALYEAGFVSSAHSEEDIAATVAAAREAFKTL
jgi:hypothetical protein